MSEQTDESQQREIFLELVTAQDSGQSVEQSRRQVAERYGISVSELLMIEKDGLSYQWPPL